MTNTGAATTRQTISSTKLLTVPEVAEVLRKSPDQLRWMIHQNRAPKSAVIGGRRMFRAIDVQAFIDAAFAEAS